MKKYFRKTVVCLMLTVIVSAYIGLLPVWRHPKQNTVNIEVKIDTVTKENTTAEKDSIFELAVEKIKSYEGWHSAKHYPYVGYGHRLLKGDNFDHNISEEFATELLRKDLRQKMSVFSEYGEYTLILGVLAYNVGEYKIKGGYGHSKSLLIQSIENNEDHSTIKQHYVSYRRWNGKVIKSIERRRFDEFENLFENLNKNS